MEPSFGVRHKFKRLPIPKLQLEKKNHSSFIRDPKGVLYPTTC